MLVRSSYRVISAKKWEFGVHQGTVSMVDYLGFITVTED